MYLYSEEIQSHWFIMPWDKFLRGSYCPEWYKAIYEQIVDQYNIYPYEVETLPEGSTRISLNPSENQNSY